MFARVFRAFQRASPNGSWSEFVVAASRSEKGRRALAGWRRSKQIEAFPEAKRVLLKELLERHRQGRVLVFTPDNASAYRVARDHLIMPLTCDIQRRERDAALDRFRKGQLGALVSSRVLNEGLDVPDADIAIVVGGSLGDLGAAPDNLLESLMTFDCGTLTSTLLASALFGHERGAFTPSRSGRGRSGRPTDRAGLRPPCLERRMDLLANGHGRVDTTSPRRGDTPRGHWIRAGRGGSPAYPCPRENEGSKILGPLVSINASTRGWLGRGYAERVPGTGKLIDTDHKVNVDVLSTGRFPGDGKPKPIAFPDPVTTAVRGSPFTLLPVERWIELKLASGMVAAHRLKDLADLQELIRSARLPRTLAEALHPWVSAKFLELWQSVDDGERNDPY